MAGVICLIVVTNDSNHLHESFSGGDHFNSSRIGTISYSVVNNDLSGAMKLRRLV